MRAKSMDRVLLIVIGLAFLFLIAGNCQKNPAEKPADTDAATPNSNTPDPSNPTSLTTEDFKKVENTVQSALPGARKKAAEFLGNPEMAKELEDIKIILVNPTGKTSTFCGLWEGPSDVPELRNIKLHASKILTGQCDAEKTLVKYLIGSKLLENFTDESWAEHPVRMGLAHFGSGYWQEYLVQEFNPSMPYYDTEGMMGNKVRARFVLEAVYGYCLNRTYGDEKTKKLVSLLAGGTPWAQAAEQAFGEGTGVVDEKCGKCAREQLEQYYKKSGPYRPVFHEFYHKDREKFLQAGKEYLEKYPDTVFMTHLKYFMGEASTKVGKYDDALDLLEQVRTGKWGVNYLDDNAATGIVLALLSKGDCDQAKTKHEYFLELYPTPRYLMMGKWDEAYKRFCSEKTAE